jgi:hypothetical protein
MPFVKPNFHGAYDPFLGFVDNSFEILFPAGGLLKSSPNTFVKVK